MCKKCLFITRVLYEITLKLKLAEINYIEKKNSNIPNLVHLRTNETETQLIDIPYNNGPQDGSPSKTSDMI
uniref:Uncharacterized protein n=1 Tax=Anguilla anguilla TaxID=7936 RepID=A0A0E9X824_ANGAN